MAILLAVLLLVVVVLSLPIEIEFDAKWPASDQNRADLRWAFGLLRIDLRSRDSATKRTDPSEPNVEPAPRAGDRRTLGRSFRSMLADAAVRRRLLRFLKDCWRAIRKDDVRVVCRVGLDEPADTGMLWGMLGPVAGGLQTLRDCEISLTPVFSEESLECAAEGRIKLYPIQLGGLFAGLLASPPIWRGFLAARGRS